MSDRSIDLDLTDGLARLTLDRPPLNVLNLDMLGELRLAVDEVAGDKRAKVLLLTGRGKAFSAGVDVADHTEERVEPMLGTFHGGLRALMELSIPVVAAVNGAALGGGFELALACDVILVRDGAKLGFPEVTVGAFPPFAAAVLPRLVGRQHALDLILTGRTFRAAEARAVGLVTRVLGADDFEARVAAYVDRLTGLSRPVVRLAKRAVTEGLDVPVDEALERAESIYLERLMKLDDAHEGVAAFLEKRDPVWSDR